MKLRFKLCQSMLVIAVLFGLIGCAGQPTNGETEIEYTLHYVRFVAMDFDEITVENQDGTDSSYRLLSWKTKIFDYWCNPAGPEYLMNILRIGSHLIVGAPSGSDLAIAIKPGKSLKPEDGDSGICSNG